MKSKRWDQEYLLKEQYHDGSNLNARAQLHARFSTNKQGWHRWVFDQLELPPDARILELGCGPAWLWRENLDRIPSGWDITLSDFSPGMVAEAQEHLSENGRAFTFRQIDAQAIPFDDAHFDAIIANHMLYHVPDRRAALAEIRRVLRPDGHFYAATNGTKHLKEIRDLIQQFSPHTYDVKTNQEMLDVFTLENGTDQIREFFSQVRLTRYEDALVVTEVEPLLDYILSGIVARDSVRDDQTAAFGQFLADQMAATGAILITKDAGLFDALPR